MAMEIKLPDLASIKPMTVNIREDIQPIELYNITPLKDDSGFVDAIPYYLLAYGNNLEKIATLIPERRVALVVGIAGKTLSFLAKRYKIEEKSLIK